MTTGAQVTTREQQIADAAAEHGGAIAAAKALGLSRATVEVTLARYHAKACPLVVERLEERIAQLEAELRRLRRPVVVTHRRKADGGVGGKAERKAAA